TTTFGATASPIQFPEQKRPRSERYRGIHLLTAREDGSPKCVACYMCATVCPAECIYIESGERPEKTIEKYPTRFEIDLLRCVYCGFCVDACPEARRDRAPQTPRSLRGSGSRSARHSQPLTVRPRPPPPRSAGPPGPGPGRPGECSRGARPRRDGGPGPRLAPRGAATGSPRRRR